jgi:hypothetical protein
MDKGGRTCLELAVRMKLHRPLAYVSAVGSINGQLADLPVMLCCALPGVNPILFIV